MRTHHTSVLLTGFMLLWPFSAVHATDVSGTITTDTTWTVDGAPYNVIDTVTVAAGMELVIEPGVVVTFVGAAGLVVNGTLTEG